MNYDDIFLFLGDIFLRNNRICRDIQLYDNGFDHPDEIRSGILMTINGKKDDGLPLFFKISPEDNYFRDSMINHIVSKHCSFRVLQCAKSFLLKKGLYVCLYCYVDEARKTGFFPYEYTYPSLNIASLIKKFKSNLFNLINGTLETLPVNFNYRSDIAFSRKYRGPRANVYYGSNFSSLIRIYEKYYCYHNSFLEYSIDLCDHFYRDGNNAATVVAYTHGDM